MAHDNSDKAFVSSARLYTVVPETSNSRFSEVLSSASQDDEATGALPLPIKERKILFFDETVIVYVVLRILNSSEQSLKQYLPRLQIKLDVWAVSETEREGSGGSKGEGSGPERDLVFSHALRDVDDPLLIVLNAEDEEDVEREPVVLAIWQTEATLNRPRTRFQSPALIFTASANLASSKLASEASTEDEYLAGFTPAPANLFESLTYLPALRHDPPYLPISRLDRVLPDAPMDGGLIKIRHAPTRPIPVVQAVSARIRYSRLDASHRAGIIASLDFEVTRFMDLSVDLEAAHVELTHGSTEALMPQHLPISCRPRDVMTFMYRLHPAYHFDTPLPPTTTLSTVSAGSTADVISISTLASISVSDACRAKIAMAWATQIDLSAPLNPNFGPPGQSLQRANRPQSLPVGPAGSSTATGSLAGTPRTSVLWRSGITISFSGPATPVEVGRTFVWKILVVNEGPKTAKLAVIPIPQIQRPYIQSQHFGHRHAPKISSSSSHHVEKRHADGGSGGDIAPAICDENIVYALQHQNPQSSGTELLSLTPELRIGPLAPGTCHEAEIRMLALKHGPLRVEAVRVIDLVKEIEEGATAAGVMTDIRTLPNVVAVRARREEGDDDNSVMKHATDVSDGPDSHP